MSIFGNIFGSADHQSQNEMEWNELTSVNQLETISTESFQYPVLIFKHSTRCSVSRMALKQFENHYSFNVEQIKPYFLDLLSYRDISHAVADRFNVVHQSPQILLIKEGKCIFTSSHGEIDAEDLKEKIQ
ncbi:MAG TPA: bacillithiol system redox-active protein YtxJ [Flavobacterium sp.]|jgi:bacillithiol system protein YtxJ